MNVIDEIAAERRRQIEQENWTPEHDDRYLDGELVRAAATYADYAKDEGSQRAAHRYAAAGRAPASWPWDAAFFKPKDRRRDLIRAAALLVAEIERMDREADRGLRAAMDRDTDERDE